MAAGIVPDALRLEDPNRDMADRVATQDDCLLSGRGPNRLVEIVNDLCIGARFIMKVPTWTRNLATHVRPSLFKQLVGRKVVLDEGIAPADGLPDSFHRFVESLE